MVLDLTIPYTSIQRESSQPDAGTIFLDEIQTTEAQVAELTAQGVNKIIVLTHIGYGLDRDWIAQIEGVDVVVGGHSHSLLGDDETAVIASPHGSYATLVTKADGSTTCVVQAWANSKAIGNLHVDFDEDGSVFSCVGNPVFPFNPEKVTVLDASPRYDLGSEDAYAVISSLVEQSGGQVKAIEEDPSAAANLASFSGEVDELKKCCSLFFRLYRS